MQELNEHNPLSKFGSVLQYKFCSYITIEKIFDRNMLDILVIIFLCHLVLQSINFQGAIR